MIADNALKITYNNVKSVRFSSVKSQDPLTIKRRRKAEEWEGKVGDDERGFGM